MKTHICAIVIILRESILLKYNDVGDGRFNGATKSAVQESTDLPQLLAQVVVKTANVVFSRYCFEENGTELL